MFQANISEDKPPVQAFCPNGKMKTAPVQIVSSYPGDYPSGRVETRFKEEYGVWVVHGEYRGQPQIYALRTVCTHLGCITIWQESEGKFKCPCHGSVYDRRGSNVAGPAPTPLPWYQLTLAPNGELVVNKEKIVSPGTYLEIQS